MTRTDQTLRLRDGRRLGYAEFGLPDGKPIFFFHGWGDSRLTRHPDDSLLDAAGIHLMTVDRPGFGLSDFQPHRTFGYGGGSGRASSECHRLSSRLSRCTVYAARPDCGR